MIVWLSLENIKNITCEDVDDFTIYGRIADIPVTPDFTFLISGNRKIVGKDLTDLLSVVTHEDELIFSSNFHDTGKEFSIYLIDQPLSAWRYRAEERRSMGGNFDTMISTIKILRNE